MSENTWPVTVTKDRYTGSYSQGRWIAFNAKPSDCPPEVFGCDITAADWWGSHPYADFVGRGDTPMEAVRDLDRRLASASKWCPQVLGRGIDYRTGGSHDR